MSAVSSAFLNPGFLQEVLNTRLGVFGYAVGSECMHAVLLSLLRYFLLISDTSLIFLDLVYGIIMWDASNVSSFFIQRCLMFSFLV